jgi:hypothetical protein
MSALRKQPLTDERAMRIGKSYRQMYILAAIMELEYTNFMDTNFKNPITHHKIATLKGCLDHVIKAHRLAVDKVNEDNTLFALDDLNDIIKLMTNLAPEQIKDFAAGFSKMVNK